MWDPLGNWGAGMGTCSRTGVQMATHLLARASAAPPEVQPAPAAVPGSASQPPADGWGKPVRAHHRLCAGPGAPLQCLPLVSPLGLQLGLLHLCQPLLQALLGPDLSLQRRLQLQSGRGLHLLQPSCLPLVVLVARGRPCEMPLGLAASEAPSHHSTLLPMPPGQAQSPSSATDTLWA